MPEHLKQSQNVNILRIRLFIVYVSLENTLRDANENKTDNVPTIKALSPVDVGCVDGTRVVVAAVVIGCEVAKATMILLRYLIPLRVSFYDPQWNVICILKRTRTFQENNLKPFKQS